MAQSMMLIEKCSHCVSWYDIETGGLQGRLALPDYPHAGAYTHLTLPTGDPI